MTDEKKERATGRLNRLRARLRPLAPLEMQDRFKEPVEIAGELRVLRSEPERHRLAIEMEERADERWWVPGKVLVVVIVLSTAFIGWIAWLISRT